MSFPQANVVRQPGAGRGIQSAVAPSNPARPTADPEVLQPRIRGGDHLFSDSNLDMLSHLLDDFLRIPGTNIRFGLDGIIGLIPGIGDILGAMASWIIILAAWLRGVPKVTLARMLANVAIETILGTVPVLGDAFDIAWKANRRNFALLQRAMGDAGYPGYETSPSSAAMPVIPGMGVGQHRLGVSNQQRKRHAASDWFFLLWLFLGMLLLLAIPLALLAYVAGRLFSLGMRH